MKKIKVGIVNYLNTKPLLYGLEREPFRSEIELIPGYPAEIAGFLLEGSIDLGLVPVAIIPQLREYRIVSDYCIGCNGPVASVAVFSEVPLSEVKTLLLDYQSRTSVELVKLLLRDFWKLEPELVDTREEFGHRITGSTAGLLIGDRALRQRTRSAYRYDLGEAWKKHTGLPFVFAAWVSNHKLDEEFIRRFNEANSLGFEKMDEIVAQNPFPYFDLRQYYREYISYILDKEKKKGLELFLEKISVNH